MSLVVGESFEEASLNYISLTQDNLLSKLLDHNVSVLWSFGDFDVGWWLARNLEFVSDIILIGWSNVFIELSRQVDWFLDSFFEFSNNGVLSS